MCPGSAATLGSNTLIFGTNTSSVTFAGVISGTTGAIQKQGLGTAVLSGINTYGGGTTLNAGILNINADAALGTAPVIATANLSVTGSSTLQIPPATTVTLNANRQHSGF